MPVKSASRFDRHRAEWVDLAMTDGVVGFDVPAAAGELIRVAR